VLVKGKGTSQDNEDKGGKSRKREQEKEFRKQVEASAMG
jgi:hypothetical protein